MKKEGLKLIGKLIMVIALLYGMHRVFFSFFEFDTTQFKYSLLQLYLFFGLCSVVIIALLLVIRQKDLDIVGNTFLLATTIKMVACYLVARPILTNITQGNPLEKWNFFFLFILFLLLETVVTIVILNKKEN